MASPPASVPTPTEIQSQFEQAITLSLHLWPALTLAVQNCWGGPDSGDKRSWLAGVVVDLFPNIPSKPAALTALRASSSRPTNPDSVATDEPDAEEIEQLLLQVMLDEFEVNIDDDSAFDVAEQIVRFRRLCVRGKFDEVKELSRRYEASKGKLVVFAKGPDQEEENESSWEDGDSGHTHDDDNDVDMDGAPPPVATFQRAKSAPEVDQEGFTKVTKKKR